MQFYQELTLLPSYDISDNVLWSHIYRQLHIGLVSLFNDEGRTFGISLPGYSLNGKKSSLGSKLRIFAEEEQSLEKLNLSQRLAEYEDYLHITKIRVLPHIKGYAVYSRVHSVKTVAQKSRRYAARHNTSVLEAEKLFPQPKQFCQCPYVQMKSLSNGNSFRLFIKKTIMDGDSKEHSFSVYGLSETSTVPEF